MPRSSGSTSWSPRRHRPRPFAWESAPRIRWPCTCPISSRSPRTCRERPPSASRAALRPMGCPWASRSLGGSGTRRRSCAPRSLWSRTSGSRHAHLCWPSLRQNMPDPYETVIGLECHVELATQTKMFCGCRNAFGAPANTNVCPVCLGHPGTLPVPNETAIAHIVKIGLALHCRIAPHSLFHRKNYFYPDMPKNFQISQYDLPICVDGHLDLDVDGGSRRIGITRVHMEEDTGKSSHAGVTGRIAGADYSLEDYNRAGVPLVEVVSEPDMRSAEEARAYLTELRSILEALGVSDVRMEEGSLRCDANVSTRVVGSPDFGVKVEIKNLNSIRSLYRAVRFEEDRQRAAIEAGEPLTQETRHWDE